MAYVAKSIRVWDAIKFNITKLFKDRLEHAYMWSSYTDEKEFSLKCYRAVITESMQTHMEALPQDFWSRSKTFTFKFKIKEDPVLPTEGGVRINTSFDAVFEDKHLFPRHWSNWNDEHTLSNDAIPVEIRDVILRREKQIRAVEQEKTDFVDGAKTLYTRAKSINQFVKIWEPALSLLDEDVVERLRRKVERNVSAKDQGISDEELEKLNASFVKARVSQ